MGDHDLSNSTQARVQYFCDHYEGISQYHLTGRKKTYIGSKGERRCRYCGKTKSNTSFRMVAHAFPRFIGNRTLLANDECDECNKSFGTVLEDHFAKFLKPHLTAAQVAGKRGIPTVKSRSGKSRFEVKPPGPAITIHPDDPIVEMHDEKNEFTFRTFREAYVPMAVFKCLTKMAIAIIPEDLLHFFGCAANWIRLNDHGACPPPIQPLICLETFTPGPRPYPGVHSLLLKRKHDRDLVPYMIFGVAVGNSMYQIIVPSPEKDWMLQGKEVAFVPLPEPFAANHPYDASSYHPLDLSSAEICRDELIRITFRYSSKRLREVIG
ncbi:MAG: HNH endonuclease [Desulfomonilaceae bacterium]